MSDNKCLAFSIIQFLHDQLRSGNLSSGAQESLEGGSCDAGKHDSAVSAFSSLLKPACCSAVAVQCLETAFEVSTDDQSLAVPMTLPEIFASATGQVAFNPVRTMLEGFSRKEVSDLVVFDSVCVAASD